MKPIAVTLGDPAGIGAEIVFRAIEQIEPDIPLMLFGDWAFASESARSAGLAPQLERVTSANATSAARSFVDIRGSRGAKLRPGFVDALHGEIALHSLDAAIDAVAAGPCSALVTAPIHKQAIAMAGARFPGHTELLAEKAGLSAYGRDFAMYFDSPSLRVALLSVHLPLKAALASISAGKICDLALLVDREFERLYGRRPEIGVAGVNPHAGEGGMFGSEDEIVKEGVALAQSQGIEISGPHAADTVFHRAADGSFDVVLSLYHDQGLIAVKTLHFDRSVNVTLGLPWLRASVDHGTAFDIAGLGIADARPMRYAIEWAWEHSERYRR